MRTKARRNHKDSLFCRLFSDRNNALSLYNALTEAVDAAVDTCIRRGGKLADFMRKHKAEVNSMYLFGVDFEAIHREAMQREAQEKLKEAWADGITQGQERALRNLMDSLSMTAEQAMDALKIPAEEREKYAARLGVVPAEA